MSWSRTAFPEATRARSVTCWPPLKSSGSESSESDSVPTSLCDSNAAFNSGSCGALRKVVVLFFPGRGIRKGGHQPVSSILWQASRCFRRLQTEQTLLEFENHARSLATLQWHWWPANQNHIPPAQQQQQNKQKNSKNHSTRLYLWINQL